MPESKLSMEELQAYYEQHVDDYGQRAMVAMRSLAFTTAEDAKSALHQLRNGTDYRWLKNNAENQLPHDDESIVHFHGELLMVDSLPQIVRQTIEGAPQESIRTFVDDDGNHHVLIVDRVIPASTPALKDIQQEVAKKAYDEKLQSVFKQWTAKLREAYPVEVYVKEFLTSDDD